MNSPGIQEKIGYRFKDENLLVKALTHSSYIKEKDEGCDKNNERLEFLGDAIFDAVISEELYRRLAGIEEGKLTKLRALIVCEKSLAGCGRQIGLGGCMLLGKGEEHTGGRDKDAVLADALEAVIGAVFLDGGYDAARNMVLNIFKDRIDHTVTGKTTGDYKTELQEMIQAKGENRILYLTDKEEGPDHDKTFYVSLFYADTLIGRGQGKNKKEAEQNAAKEALKRGVDICISKG